jgi:hypothetical protein
MYTQSNNFIESKLKIIKLNFFLDFLKIIFCLTQFLGLISWTKSKLNIPTFDGCQTKGLQLELSSASQTKSSQTTFEAIVLMVLQGNIHKTVKMRRMQNFSATVVFQFATVH